MNVQDFDIRPRSPVVTSQLTANHLIEKWVQENDFSTLKDRDGVFWQLELQTRELPDPSNPYGLVWETVFVLKADIAIVDLLACGVLDGERDARLIQLVGVRNIPFTMKPRVMTAKSEDEMRKLVIEALPELRQDLLRVDLRQAKRQVVGRWVDASRVF